jgi:hypothetical protein
MTVDCPMKMRNVSSSHEVDARFTQAGHSVRLSKPLPNIVALGVALLWYVVLSLLHLSHEE